MTADEATPPAASAPDGASSRPREDAAREDRAPVAAIVVTWNAAADIEACLDSLRGLIRPPAETVVVDNASGDATRSRVARYPEVRLIGCEENVGFCRANNLGIHATRAPFVLLLNPDARLSRDFLELLLPAFDDPRVGIATGKLLRPDGRTLDSAGQLLARSRRPLDRGYGRPDRGQYDRDQEVFGACAAAALYRRAMLLELERLDGCIFDERFFAFYEDLDLAWRARRRGWRAVYRYRAVGYHARGASGGRRGPRRGSALWHRPAWVRFHVVKNRYLTILRNDSPAAFARDLPFVLARDLATATLLLLTSPGVLWRLWRARGLWRETLVRRRLDGARRASLS